jgi:hypothetical protein
VSYLGLADNNSDRSSAESEEINIPNSKQKKQGREFPVFSHYWQWILHFSTPAVD